MASHVHSEPTLYLPSCASSIMIYKKNHQKDAFIAHFCPQSDIVTLVFKLLTQTFKRVFTKQWFTVDWVIVPNIIYEFIVQVL